MQRYGQPPEELVGSGVSIFTNNEPCSHLPTSCTLNYTVVENTFVMLSGTLLIPVCMPFNVLL